MTASIHRLTTTPSASDTTADAITDSGLITIDTEAEVTALAWETIDFPDATTTDITSYLTVADVVSELGLFSVDLSDFLTDCAIVDSCQYYAYANRYDGFALGHWVDLAAPATAVSLAYDTILATKTAGDDVANLPAAVGLCDADTFVCWGWYLEGTYDSTIDAATETSSVDYAAVFSSGVTYLAFDDAVPTAANVLVLFGTTLLDVSSTSSTTGYGFSDVYWHTDADTTATWPEGVLTYRFQAVDLPRYSVGDSISIWSLGSVTSSSANNEGATDVVLANAHMLFSTAAAALVCSTLL
jgi:hypothetical protein